MKRQTIKLLLIFLVLVVFLFAVFAQDSFSQPKKSFLWKVQSKTNTVYVLGSIHYLKKEMYPLDEKIEKAFEQSNILGVEVNVNDISKMDVHKIIESTVYSGGETLEKHLSPEASELVKKQLTEMGTSLEAVNKYRPWFLALSLASIEIVKLGFDPNYGVDRYFLSKAMEKKKIVELESFEYHINLFSNLSEKDQELFLLYTLKDIKVLEQELDKLVKAWTAGDGEGIEWIMTQSIKEDKRLIPIYEKLVVERNREMVSKIEEYLKEKETIFVIVGAGHLVGSQGIIELLKGKGFLPEQL
jgi:uncharacterized protein YbaP (TraB family)